MAITTRQDWIDEARYVVPLLPEYMSRISGQVNPSIVEDELNKHVSNENWITLSRRFHEIWHWLPDRSDIHVHPFSRLCDLCSEDWVLSEDV